MDAVKPKLRSFRPTPGWLVLGLLVVDGLLWVSERFQWFAFNSHEGWTVLIAVAAVGAAMLVMLLWFIASLIFRRRIQFTVRSLLVLVIAVAVPSSWLAAKLREVKREESAALLKSRGTVQWDESAPGPVWLRRVLGEHFFGHVRFVWLIGDEVTDNTLEPLDAMTHLQELALDETHVTDAGLERLQELRELKELDIRRAGVTNLGLQKIAGLKQLETLDISYTQVTDAGLKKLAGLCKLQTLWLYGTNATDAGLEHLQRMKQLTYVHLRGTHVTAAGVKKLQQALPNCTIDIDLEP